MTTLPASLTFDDVDLTIIDHEQRPWLSAADLARALGYTRADKVTQIYSRNKDEFSPGMTEILKLRVAKNKGLDNSDAIRVFSPRGCHLVAML